MPYRTISLVNEEIYHVFNRSVAKQPIFLTSQNYKRAVAVIDFYRYQNLTLRFSHYDRLPQEQRKDFRENLAKNGQLITEILTFCLMPNHFHFLLRQLKDNGISVFMRNFQNSYSRYFNTKQERSGALFQSMFKAVRIESDEQLIHVSRYIHLNPVSSMLIKIDSLRDYHWSSFGEFMGSVNSNLTDTKVILGYFKSRQAYEKFVFDQADYQQKLEKIKHLALE